MLGGQIMSLICMAAAETRCRIDFAMISAGGEHQLFSVVNTCKLHSTRWFFNKSRCGYGLIAYIEILIHIGEFLRTLQIRNGNKPWQAIKA